MDRTDTAEMGEIGHDPGSVVFFRIDDVGDWSVDADCLRPLLDVFIRLGLPFNLQVIPGHLSGPTAEYLRRVRASSPSLLEIDQHGYTHDVEEFSSQASLDQQMASLVAGRRILEEALGTFSPVFTPPEHVFTEATLQALDLLGYRVFSKETRVSAGGTLFYETGRLLRRRFLLGKKVSYHTQIIPGTRMVELSVQVNTAKEGGDIKGVEEFLSEYRRSRRASWVTGILIHPIDLSSPRDRENMESLLHSVRQDSSAQCLRLSEIAARCHRVLGIRGGEVSDALASVGEGLVGTQGRPRRCGGD